MKTTINNLFSFLVKEREYKKKATLFINLDKESYRFMRMIVWFFHQELYRPKFAVLMATIQRMYKTNGAKFTVSYWKEVHICLMKFLAKDKYEISAPEISLDSKRLPRCIPLQLRSKIVERDVNTIRAVLTLCSIYRVIKVPGEVKLSTITEPSSGETTVSLREIKEAVAEIQSEVHYKPLTNSQLLPIFTHDIPLLTTSGPNNNISIFGSPLDAIALFKYPKELGRLIMWCYSTGQLKLIVLLVCSSILIFPFYLLYRLIGWSRPLRVGRLTSKLEPAGKVRVFAMVDYWTQWSLMGLHTFIFTQVLRKLECDGTFNQGAPLKRLAEIVRDGPAASKDLSAATDRLPLPLQVDILNTFFDTSIFTWWGRLWKRPFHFKEKPLYYSVGQPMGAYSSWASLALSHHVILRIAAIRVGLRNFTKYAILGDDIVIGHDAVAKSYQHLMDILGVGISKHKSLQSSNGTFEFAKRLVSHHVEFSPLGAANILLTLRNISHLPSVFTDALQKGVPLSTEGIIHLLDKYPFKLTKLLRESLVQVCTLPCGGLPQSQSSQRESRAFRVLWGIRVHNSQFTAVFFDKWSHLNDGIMSQRLQAAREWVTPCARLSFDTFKISFHRRSFVGRFIDQMWTYFDWIFNVSFIFKLLKKKDQRKIVEKIRSSLMRKLTELTNLFNLGYWLFVAIVRHRTEKFISQDYDKWYNEVTDFFFRYYPVKGRKVEDWKGDLIPLANILTLPNEEWDDKSITLLNDRGLLKITKQVTQEIVKREAKRQERAYLMNALHVEHLKSNAPLDQSHELVPMTPEQLEFLRDLELYGDK